MVLTQLQKLRSSIATIDAEEIRAAVLKAQMRLQCEQLLPVLCIDFSLSISDAHKLLSVAVQERSTVEGVVVLLHELAATWVGTSALHEDLVAIARTAPAVVPLGEVLAKVNSTLSEVVGAAVVPSTLP